MLSVALSCLAAEEEGEARGMLAKRIFLSSPENQSQLKSQGKNRVMNRVSTLGDEA